MGNLIITIRSTTKLFKQPKQIGDMLECDGKDYLILGIEKFKVYGSHLKIWYTCQDLSQSDYVSLKKAYKEPHLIEIESTVKHDDERITKLELGKTWTIGGNVYKVTEYTEIKLKGTDIYIAMAARPLYPIDRKEAKAKLFSERRKKLNLEIL